MTCFLSNLGNVSIANIWLPMRTHPQSGTGVDTSNRPEGAFDMTPSFMYYSVAWVWLEFLTRGQEAAQKAMAKCLDLAQIVSVPTDAGGTDGASDVSGDVGLGGTLKGKRVADYKKNEDHCVVSIAAGSLIYLCVLGCGPDSRSGRPTCSPC